MNGAVVSRNDGFERRARVLPWGIEIQVWRLVETLTLPTTAGALPIAALFPEPVDGAIPSARIDDEKTLENVVVDSGGNEVEIVYDDSGQGGER